MMEIIVLFIISRIVGAAREALYIVVSRFRFLRLVCTGVGIIERLVRARHSINADLISIAVFRRAPIRRAINILGPLVGYVRIPFGFNGMNHIPAGSLLLAANYRGAAVFRIATAIISIAVPPIALFSFIGMRMRFLSIERDGIHIALIIHIHNRRAVARDGLLPNVLRGEAGIALRRRAGLRAGGAGLGFGFRIGILIVIGVFQPMNDGVARIGIGRPDGVKRQLLTELLPEGERRAADGLRPVVEGIAGAGGGGGRGGRAVALYERGLDIGAALRIKGDPVTIFNYRLQRNILALKFDLRNQRVIFIARVIPADNGLFIADRIGHALRGNRVAVRALLRDHDFALLIGEEYEVHVREAGVDGDGKRGAADGRGDGEGKLVSTFVKPADEFLVRFRRAGIVEGFAVLENLASEFLRAIHKDIGNSSHRRLHDAEQRKAITGLRAAGDGHDGRQRVHGRAADEHDQRHQQGKTPTKLVFHKKLILPMKFR